ncbi:glycoside hydrolase family 16 protein [Pseudonocardia bannensis]|uniref:Glycoside hydrolase family 16 protein n=1 Tax=Pseudonocardia bannensis TaxID=630973 RepID=A0A848DPK8_9PSEU|nr:glycoside hydrolase family 16 protein [Pseudonocardia bannensis]NMH94678.1 glycoside hydrolase family 16 protein [Pseudonocardia bannensis]
MSAAESVRPGADPLAVRAAEEDSSGDSGDGSSGSSGGSPDDSSGDASDDTSRGDASGGDQPRSPADEPGAPSSTEQPAANAPAPVQTPPDPCAPQSPAGTDTTAATTLGWGEPVRVDEFTGPALDASWNVYNGPGYTTSGRRTPDALRLQDGLLTITGTAEGATGGMAWNSGQQYGRWEGRVRAPAGDRAYNPLLLLWPDADDFPVGGEIDFMEMLDPARQKTHAFLHHGPRNDQVFGEVAIDGTQWNNWAVEWTPNHVAAFVNGKEWFRTTDRSILPSGPMHLCIQLDFFPRGGVVEPSSMQVDWVRQYALSPEELAAPPPPAPAPAPAQDTGEPGTGEAPAAPAGDTPRDSGDSGGENGGDTSGGDTSGGDTSGGDTSGGDGESRDDSGEGGGDSEGAAAPAPAAPVVDKPRGLVPDPVPAPRP